MQNIMGICLIRLCAIRCLSLNYVIDPFSLREFIVTDS